MAASGTLVIRFIGDLKEFERSTSMLGKRLTSTGALLTKSLTVPILGVGVAATKLAMDFEDSMSLIEGVVGLSKDQVEQFSEVILTEGPKWGKAPKELADALYFVTSSGFEGAQALDILKNSAMASSAGLGETETIADMVTSAINAYGKENLSAAQSVDILAKAIDLGKLEADEFAGVMGRVLPVASAMGVSFDEVSAAMSAMSMSGTDAAEGATQLRGIFAALLKPTVQANAQLADMGLSAEGLRQQLDQKGLLSVLDTLTQKFDGNTAATAKVFGNVRALTGVMNMMGANVKVTRSIFDQMGNSAGSMQEAFDVASQTARFKFDAAMAQVQSTLIRVGVVLLPILGAMLTKVAGWLEKASAAWQGLDSRTQHVILAIAGFVAILGPALMLIGQIAMVVAALANPVGLVVVAIVALGAAFAVIMGSAGGLQGALAKVFEPFTNGKFTSALSSLGASLMGFFQSLLPTLKQIGSDIMAALGPALKSIADVVQSQLIPAIQRILPIVKPVVEFLLQLFGMALVGVIKGVADVVVGLVKVIAGAFNLISALVHGDWSAAWAAVKQIAAGAVQAVWGAVMTWLNAGVFGLFKQVGKLLLGSWRALWTGIRSLGDSAMSGLRGLMEAGLKGLGNLIKSAVKSYLNFWLGLGKSLVTRSASMWVSIQSAIASGIARVIGLLRGLPGKAVSAVGDLGSALLAKGKALIQGLLHGVTTKATELMSWFKSLPSKITGAIGDLSNLLANIGRTIISGLIHGIDSMVGELKSKLGSITKMIPDWKGPEDKDRRLLHPAGIAIMAGLIEGLTKGSDGVHDYLSKLTDQIEHALDKAAKKRGTSFVATSKAVLAGLAAELQAVRDNAKAYDKWKSDLAAAREALAAAKQEAADFAAQVAEGFASLSDVTQLGARSDAEGNPVALTSAAIIEDLQKRAADAEHYKDLIAQLATAGLNDTTLKQLLAAGVESGLATAQAIAAGGAGAIGQINALTTQIANAGVETGNIAAQEFFGAGIQAAQGLVDGLVAMEPEINKIAKRLAKKLAKAIRSALGIHSPSRVFAEIGRLTAEGMAQGIIDGSRSVIAATDQLARMSLIAPTDRNGMSLYAGRSLGPVGAAGGSYGGGAVHIEQNFPAAADPQAAANAAAGRIVAALGV